MASVSCNVAFCATVILVAAGICFVIRRRLYGNLFWKYRVAHASVPPQLCSGCGYRYWRHRGLNFCLRCGRELCFACLTSPHRCIGTAIPDYIDPPWTPLHSVLPWEGRLKFQWFIDRRFRSYYLQMQLNDGHDWGPPDYDDFYGVRANFHWWYYQTRRLCRLLCRTFRMG